jgi:5,10-methylenetetrahydrofolate reductase
VELCRAGYDAAPHLSCIGSSADKLRDMLNAYKAQGVKRIVASRGDLPSGYGAVEGNFQYAINSLSSSVLRQVIDSISKWQPIQRCTLRQNRRKKM